MGTYKPNATPGNTTPTTPKQEAAIKKELPRGGVAVQGGINADISDAARDKIADAINNRTKPQQ